MVKQLQQVNSCIFSSGKRVSFKADSYSEDFSPRAEDEEKGDAIDVSEDVERLLKVMQSLNVARRMESVERFTDISKMMNVERKEIFGGPKRIVSDTNLHIHRNECLESGTSIVKNTNIHKSDVIPVEMTIDDSLRVVNCVQLGLSPVASPPQTAVDSVNCLEDIATSPIVLRVSSIEDGLISDDVQSSSESATTDDTGSGNSSRRGSADSLHREPNRGYSSQRRHGRKDSLGTTVDFTRLIPTFVSDNEDFRQKEYQRKLSVQSIELKQSSW